LLPPVKNIDAAGAVQDKKVFVLATPPIVAVVADVKVNATPELPAVAGPLQIIQPAGPVVDV